jgi:demethylmenaquinone methyltransferase/2-methoxy-6-polyprenyl-1,4-benzoquinol methylase
MMRYYWETMEACVPPEDVLAAMNRVGLGAVDREIQATLFSEYSAVKS